MEEELAFKLQDDGIPDKKSQKQSTPVKWDLLRDVFREEKLVSIVLDSGNLEVLSPKSFRLNPDLESVGVVLFSRGFFA
jgi:hypothetical protein